MLADLILIGVGIFGLTVASLFDAKTREIPDWLNFSLIGCGLGIRLLHSLTFSDWPYFFYGLLGCGLLFLFGSLMYRAKQWGGGDVKLLTALGAIFATTPYYLKSGVPFLIILLINLLLVGALYGLVWSVVLSFRHKKKFVKEVKKEFEKNKNARFFSLTACALILIGMFFTTTFLVKAFLSFAVILTLTYSYLTPVIRSVENACMYKWLHPKKLTEGDWIAKEVKIKGRIVCGPKDLGIEKKQIRRLIKARIKRVLVKEGIPFVPSFLIGTLLTLILGNFFL